LRPQGPDEGGHLRDDVPVVVVVPPPALRGVRPRFVHDWASTLSTVKSVTAPPSMKGRHASTIPKSSYS